MGQPKSSTQHRTLLGVIEKLALRFFTFLLLVFSFLLFYFGPLIAPAYKDVFVSFSTSLFASLVFAQLYSFIVERHHQQSVSLELEYSVQQALEQMKQAEQTHIEQIIDRTIAKMEEVEKSHYHPISQRFHELIPSSSFSPTDKPDRAFNELLAHELKQSRSPPTYLYEKESFYYRTYLTDFYQTFELAEHSILLQAKTTEQELADFLQKLGCDPLTIPQLRQEARAFREDFFAQLGWHIDP